MTATDAAAAVGVPELVSTGWLAGRIGSPALVVLDATVLLLPPARDGDFAVRSGHGAWAAGHIPGARHADLIGDLSDGTRSYHFARPSVAHLAGVLARWRVGAGSHVVAYDAGGGIWAARLWWLLRSVGVPVSVLDGGWTAWTAEHRAVEVGRPLAGATAIGTPATRLQEPGGGPGGPLVIQEDPAAWLDRRDVEDIVAGRRDDILVCALSPSVYSGSEPTRYARRGHIPGSMNVPARDLTDASGRLLPRAELAVRLAPLLATDGRRLALYCGGGIAAALLALALTVLGAPGLSIYDGSLEEWAADPSLPLEVSE